MKRDDSTRRYSRADMQRILEIASLDAPLTSDTAPGGDALTLAEIQDIGRELGIDPSRVERASASLVTEAPLDPQVALGTYQLERGFSRALDGDEMRFVAEEANQYFGVEGKLRQTHSYVEWYSEEARAFVGMVNDSDGTRVRVILDRASQFYLGGGVIGILGLLGIGVVVSAAPGILGAVGAVGMAALTGAGLAGFWRWRKVEAIRRLEGLVDSMMDGPVSLSGPVERA